MNPPFEPLRPSAGRAFYKAHGLGNDYLVVEEGSAWRLEPGAVERVCHRTLGVGSDGIVVVLAPADAAPFRLRMFNPDGSEFERSGNGLRVLASWLHRTGRVVLNHPFAVEVGGDRIGMTVHGAEDGRYDISVQMGQARTGAEAVQADRGMLMPERVGGEGSGADGVLELPDGRRVPVLLVSVGNPHCVVFTDGLADIGDGAPRTFFTGDEPFSRAALNALGPALTAHPAFAGGTNVQLARVVEGGSAAAERGTARDIAPGGPTDVAPGGPTDIAPDGPTDIAPDGPTDIAQGGPTDVARGGSTDAPRGGGIVEALVWERGVGHTSASGTSACAVAVAAVRSGRLPPGSVEVRMEGGTLRVEVSSALDVVLRGPVEEVMTGEMTPGFTKELERPAGSRPEAG